MKTRHLAFICLSLSAAVAMAANDVASGSKHRDDAPLSVEYLAHIPRLLYVNAILISPDGGTVATLRGENTSWNEGGKPLALQVWSVPGGDLVWTAKSPVFRLLSFSPDGKRLVGITEDTRVALWDTATGRVRSRLSARNVSFSAAVFSPDGQTLMTSINRFEGGGGIPMQPSSGAIQLWRAKNGRFLRELTTQTRPVSALAVSPNGTSLAVAQQGPGPGPSINLLDLASDSTRYTLVLGADTFHVSSLAFSPDRRWLAAASGTHDGRGEVRLWDVASGELKRTVTDADLGASSVGWESQVAFSPGGTILAIAGDEQTVNLWSMGDDKWRGSFGPSVPPDPGRCVMQFVRDGLLLAGVNWFQQVEPYHPKWIIELGGRELECRYGDNGPFPVPDLDDPIVLRHHLDFIRRLGAQYDGHPDIDHVDLGTVGWWAEWHMSQSNCAMPTPATQRAIVDAYLEAFRQTTLVMLMGGGDMLVSAEPHLHGTVGVRCLPTNPFRLAIRRTGIASGESPAASEN